jgi:hypothetical protein
MKKDLLPVRRALLPVLACAVVALTGASGALAAPGPPGKVVIDDFSTGPDTIPVTTGFAQEAQSGGMVGNVRCIRLDVPLNPYARPNIVTVGGGHLFLETGVGVNHAVTLLYGMDTRCANDPMDLNLKGTDRFRLEFDLLDLPLAGAVVVWSPAGISSMAICATGVAPGVGFTCDMPFSEFAGEADFAHIQYIAIVLQTGGAIFSHDYGLKSITAVMDPGSPSGQHASTVAEAPARLPLQTNPLAIRTGR